MKTMRWTSVLLFGLVSGFLVRPAIAATDGTMWQWGGNWNSADRWVGGIWPKDGGVAHVDVPNQYPSAHAGWAISVNVPTTLGAFDCGDFGCRRSYAVECDGFCWSWNESNMDGDGDRDDDRDAVFNSISGVLDVDADLLLDVAHDAVQFAASATWHSRDDGAESAV